MRTSNYDRSARRRQRCGFHQLLYSLVIVAATGSVAAAGGMPELGRQPTAPADESLTDDRITRALERELIRDDAVPFDGLDLSTADGIVTIAGEVDNLLARDRAIHIAQAVKGVRAVIDQMRVVPVARTDGELRADVTSALASHPATDSYEVMVSVEDGVVTLYGNVDSWTERELSATVASGVKGVKGVANDITVSWKDQRPDTEIAADVKAALAWDRLVDDDAIAVEVSSGQVTLTGSVGSAAERRRAAAMSWVSGVRLVKSDGLAVEPSARADQLRSGRYVQPADEAIADAIEDALVFDPRVISVHVTPEVENGIVTLSGTVPTAGARQAAVAAARNTVGVWRVKDHLRVRSAVDIDDASLAASVRQALARDPYVERFDVTVGVRDGIATLTGDVDMSFQKRQAEEVAANVNGVVAVRNFLGVKDPASRLAYQPFADQRPPDHYNWFHPPAWAVRSDWEIAQDIRSELWWSPFIDADDVKVTVRDGVATLTGTVSTWNERRVASENAIEGGAISVQNHLEVAPRSSATTSSP